MPAIKNLSQAQTQTRIAADKAKDLGLISPEFHKDLTDGTVTGGDQYLGNLLCTTLETNLLTDPKVGADMQRIKDAWMKDSAPYIAALNKYGADHPETRRAEQQYLQAGGPLFERYTQSGKLDAKTAASLRAADALTDAVAEQRPHQNKLKELLDISEWSSQLRKIWDLT